MTPFSRSVSAAALAARGVGVGEQRADVPAVAAGGRPHRVGQVGDELGRAQRAGSAIPSSVVG